MEVNMSLKKIVVDGYQARANFNIDTAIARLVVALTYNRDATLEMKIAALREAIAHLDEAIRVLEDGDVSTKG
jgi:hypothetical protein